MKENDRYLHNLYYAETNLNFDNFSFTRKDLPDDLKYLHTKPCMEKKPDNVLFLKGPFESQFLYSIFVVSDNEDLVLTILTNCKAKIWINNLYVGCATSFDMFYFYPEFCNGENLIVIELDLKTVKEKISLNIGCLKRRNEKESITDGFLSDYRKGIQFFSTTEDHLDYNPQFLFLLRDYRIFDSALLHVCNLEKSPIISMPVTPLELFKPDFETYRVKNPLDIGCFVVLKVFFADGSVSQREKFVALKEYSREKQMLLQKSSEFLQLKDNLHALDYEYLYVLIESKKMYNRRPSITDVSAVYKLRTFIDNLKTEELPYYQKSPGGILYYKSQIDDSIKSIKVCLPKKVKSDNLGVCFFVNLNGFSSPRNTDELLALESDCIFVSVAINGYTSGTPISESILLEAYSLIHKIYKIDDSRIYWFGYCNNGYAIWNILQGYPHLSTGSITISACPYIGNIRNIQYGTNIIYYSKFETILERVLFRIKKSVSNIRLIKLETSHVFNKVYLDKLLNYNLLQERLELFPKKIVFRTELLRHNKCFWFSFNNIALGKKYAKVKAIIADENSINITISNCHDFTISVPPYMVAPYRVMINGVLYLVNEQTQILHFLKKGNGYSLLFDNPYVVSRKGTGILDVYYGPLRIIKGIGEAENIIAKNFSTPKTGTRTTSIRYPIFNEDCVPDEVLENNLVLVSLKNNMPYYQAIRENLKIITNTDGFYYLGQKYVGDYCVFQVIQNPYNPAMSIVDISSNNIDLYKRSVFLKWINIPSILSGISQYWNNEALILLNGDIYSIYEWGEEMKKM